MSLQDMGLISRINQGKYASQEDLKKYILLKDRYGQHS